MRIFRAPSIGRAHELVVRHILEKGRVVVTEDGEATVETDPVALVVRDPFTVPMVSPRSRLQRGFMEAYARDLVDGSGAEFEYDYHRRLFCWGEGCAPAAGGPPFSIDQIDYIVEKLSKSPVSRRALAVTWIPPVDEDLDDCPCLQLVQCIIRDGALHMHVVFRSNDMLTAAGANMFALAHLQKHIADHLGLPCGTYTHISLVPHIYHIRDAADIPPFCEEGRAIRPVPEVCRSCGRCGRG
ncbi:MAG: thymidylate synthase [Methanoculleaceae archaeon]